MRKIAREIVNKWLCEALDKNNTEMTRESCIVLQALNEEGGFVDHTLQEDLIGFYIKKDKEEECKQVLEDEGLLNIVTFYKTSDDNILFLSYPEVIDISEEIIWDICEDYMSNKSPEIIR